VYGLSGAEEKAVCVGECKLRIRGSEPVTEDEVNELVSKMELIQRIEEKEDREVKGYFFSNIDYSSEALQLATEHGIRPFKARLSRNWQRSPDWTVTGLQEIKTGAPPGG
jgi:hypothetical protein